MKLTYEKLDPDNDAAIAAKLVFHTDVGLFTAFFGPEDQALAPLEQLIRAGGNSFGYENIRVARSPEGILGLLLGYDGNEKKRFEKTEIKAFVRVLGLPACVKLSATALPVINRLLTRNIPGDAFYISNVSVKDEFRGKGVGTFLVQNTEKNAKRKGLKKLLLDVELHNDGAKRLYERLGFRQYGKRTMQVKDREEGTYAMEKPL